MAAGTVNWRGDAFAGQVRAEMKRRTAAASIRLSSRVKAEISQPGTLRYQAKGGRDRRGRFLARGKKTLYNFTHSAPGNPPYKQEGRLRASITWELVQVGGAVAVVGRVGTNVKYAYFLELGTRRMKPRPFLRYCLKKYGPEVAAILTRKVPAGGLAAITTNQFRSGILGRGAYSAGFAR